MFKARSTGTGEKSKQKMDIEGTKDAKGRKTNSSLKRKSSRGRSADDSRQINLSHSTNKKPQVIGIRVRMVLSPPQDNDIKGNKPASTFVTKDTQNSIVQPHGDLVVYNSSNHIDTGVVIIGEPANTMLTSPLNTSATSISPYVLTNQEITTDNPTHSPHTTDCSAGCESATKWVSPVESKLPPYYNLPMSKDTKSDTEASREEPTRDANVQPRAEYRYNNDYGGPYAVIVSFSSNDNCEKVDRGTTWSNLKLGRELYKNNFLGYKSIKKIGGNRFRIEFDKAMQANFFIVNINKISSKAKGHIPRGLVHSTTVIDGIPSEWEIEEILQAIEPKERIVEIQRIRRRNKDKPDTFSNTSCDKIWFYSRDFPIEVKVYGVNFKTRYYISPIKRCGNCQGFGHFSDICRSKKRCPRCAGHE